MDGRDLCAFLAISCISGLCFGSRTDGDGNCAIFHNDVRHFLLSFKDTQAPNDLKLHPDIPLRSSENPKPSKKKKRGSRGGVLQRLKRRGSRFPLPTITLTNCRALNQQKQDELRTLVQYDQEFRRCNLMCLTETWLDETKTIDIPGFTALRNDRDNEAARKKGHGGGVCMLVNDRWATNFTVRDQCCTHDYEALSVSFRPFYLPREFGQLTVILVYVPGRSANGLKAAGEWIADAYHSAIARSSDQPIFILGDFNKLELNDHLPGQFQYIDVKTRLNTTLDKCYGNIENAFASRSRPAIGKSDHNVIHLLPKYRQKVKTEKPKKLERQIWDNETIEELQTCFETTDWDIFLSNDNPDEMVESVTSYMNFCVQSTVKTKTVKSYANDKPWINKDLKQCLHEKKLAHLKGDEITKRDKQKEFERLKWQEKKKYKDKTEQKFTKGNMKEAWQGLNTMMGKSSKQAGPNLPDTPDPVNDLNRFYARFDIRDMRSECDTFCDSLDTPENIEITENEVRKVFRNVKANKAPGPDQVQGKVIKKLF